MGSLKCRNDLVFNRTTNIYFFTGYLPSQCVDPYMVATHSDKDQGAYGDWIYPMKNGSMDYFQLVWMTLM